MKKLLLLLVCALCTAPAALNAVDLPQVSVLVRHVTFDDCLDVGGNDGVWNDAGSNELAGADYTRRCCQCVRVGSTARAGELTISGLQAGGGYITFRAGGWYNNRHTDDYQMVLVPQSGSKSRRTFSLSNGSFQCLVREYTMSRPFSLSFQSGESSSRVAPFFLDDVRVYRNTSDAAAIRSAKAIILTGSYTAEQVEALNAVLRQNTVVTSIDTRQASAYPAGVALETGNPNCLFYDDAARLPAAANVVANGVCANLRLSVANSFLAPEGFTATNVECDATFRDDYTYVTPLCLPFSIDAGKVSGLHSSYAIDSFSEATTTLSCVKSEGIVGAEPCLVSCIEPQPFAALRGVDAAVAATTPRTIAIDGVLMTGSYSPTAVVSAGDTARYVPTSAFPAKASTAQTVAPFDAYFSVPLATGQSLGSVLAISVPDVPVSVRSAVVENPKHGGAVYTLGGILVRKSTKGLRAGGQLPRGVYIVGGKKRLVR